MAIRSVVGDVGNWLQGWMGRRHDIVGRYASWGGNIELCSEGMEAEGVLEKGVYSSLDAEKYVGHGVRQLKRTTS